MHLLSIEPHFNNMINFIQTELQIGNDEQLKAIDMCAYAEPHHLRYTYTIHHTVQLYSKCRVQSMRLIHLWYLTVL